MNQFKVCSIKDCCMHKLALLRGEAVKGDFTYVPPSDKGCN